MDQPTGDITKLLKKWSAGDELACDQLVEYLYHELKNVAQAQLARESPGNTLQPEALVHEVYMKLGGAERIDWQDRIHFISVSARLMRQVLVDRARAKSALRRKPQYCITLTVNAFEVGEQAVDLFALDQALNRLEELNAEQAKVIELRFFGGLTIPETANVLNVSVATVNRNWRAARAWLFQTLKSGQEDEQQ